MADETIGVEIAYAKPDEQAVVALEMHSGATAEQAIRRSGLLQRFTEIDFAGMQIGIYGKVCAFDQVLQDGDRVEIYRPLAADPKDLRRQRAAKTS